MRITQIINDREEIKEIISTSVSYSEAARKIFNSDCYSCREKIKRFIKEYGCALKEKEKHFCLYCGKEIRGAGTNHKKFCCHACSASYNNKKRKKKKYCVCCGKELENRQKKFCSKECQTNYAYNEWIKRWKNGKENGVTGGEYLSTHIKRYLFEKYNYKCEKCGWGKVNQTTGKVPLQIYHIDGNCLNNKEENLQLLCPNCHSLTETFGNLNRANSKREKRYKE